MNAFHSSRELWTRALAVSPGGVHSNVRLAEQPFPLFFERAQGAYLYDVDGREYVDYVCGMGAILLGHNDPAVTEAVVSQAARGELFGGQHEGEVLLAERISRLVPSAEMVRFNLSGSEAVHSALRLSRAATGRRKVIKFEGHYHGWFDGQLVGTHPAVESLGAGGGAAPESAGQVRSALDDIVVLPWNDLESLSNAMNAAHDIAAVIMEPIMCNNGVIVAGAGYLEGVRRLCDERKVLLIFDEVITGFRVGLHGAQGCLGVTPDLTVLGKAVANGYPLSVVGGRREIMNLVYEGGVVHAGTFNGHPISVAAALSTTSRLMTDPEAYARMRMLGRALVDGIAAAGRKHGLSLRAQGPGPVFFVWFTDVERVTSYGAHVLSNFDLYNTFAQELLSEGVRVIPGGRWYLTASHTEREISRTLEAVERVCARMHVRA